MTEQPQVVNDDLVVTMAYTLTVEGEVIDTSEGSEAIQFVQGMGQIVPGLEESLYGMAVNDQKYVVVSPEEGYGLIDNDAFITILRTEFPADFPLELDTPLQIQTNEGHEFEARIDSYNDEEIRLNLNHVLAGKELHFHVEILALRLATSEEIAHGHAHEEGHHSDADGNGHHN